MEFSFQRSLLAVTGGREGEERGRMADLQGMAVTRTLRDQREDLEDIRNEIAAFRDALSRTLGTAAKSLAGLREEKQDTSRTVALLKQSAQDKQKVEKDLRSGLAEKQAEVKRLAAQVSGLKRAEAEWANRVRDADEARADLERQLERSARSETEARRRLSLSEAGGGGSRAEVASLSSLAEANRCEADQLREEIELQSKSHSLRIAELQESFQAKIKELRRVHGEQLAAARGEAEAEARAAAAGEAASGVEEIRAERDALLLEARSAREEAERTRARVEDLDQSLGKAREAEAEVRKRLAAAERESRSLRAEVHGLREQAGGASDLESKNASLAEEVTRLRSELEEASKGGGGDLAMVDVMEQQLVRLSGLLSEREEEIEQLKLTVERECLERGNLIAELSRARQGRKNM